MKEILALLKPRIISIKNSGRAKEKRSNHAKLVLLGLIGLFFWSGLFAVSLRVLFYFKGIEDIGDILNYKLLSMIIITAFVLLMFSSILTTLSKLYLSKDLYLVHSLPVPSHTLFTARWIDATLESSWMVMIFSIPVFIAYGIAYTAGPFYYLNVVLSVFSLAVIASGLAAAVVMAAVIVIPATRMKNIVIFMSILFFVVIYLSIRLLQPELLVNPEVFDTVLVYVTALETPSAPYLPTTWAFDSIKSALTGATLDGLFNLALSWSFVGSLMFLLIAVADKIYYRGFSKTQTAHTRLIKNSRLVDRLTVFLPGAARAYAAKELKTFFRDQGQWSQLFLIAALVFIYIYNFKVLPIDKSPIKAVYLQNLLSFLNMGLALFVLTAVTGRFAYPAVSTEREAFWLVKSSPGSIRNFIWIKFFIYCLPLALLTEILIVVTNHLLGVTPFMMALSTVTVFLLVPGIVALGVGLGAAYPDFKAENPAQTVTSFGGLVFMLLSAVFIGLVVLMEAGPAYLFFMADLRERSLTAVEWAWAAGSFLFVLAASTAAVWLPMRFGEERLKNYPV